MKKLLLILFVALICTTCFGQAARIGFTYNEVKTEYSGFKQTLDYVDGEKVLTVQGEDVTCIYYFDKDNGICYLSLVVPHREGGVHYLIEKYNSKYVIVDNYNWKWYNSNYVIGITLDSTDDGIMFFSFYVL